MIIVKAKTPALRLLSRGRLPFPGCALGPGDAFSAGRAGDPSPSGRSLRAARGGDEGRGRARTFDPGGPAAGWGRGPGPRRQRKAGGGRRTRAASIRGESERGGEERERGRGEPEGGERCSDRDCHWGQRSTAPGSRAAEAQLRARSPAGPRAPACPSCSFSRLEPPPAPQSPGVARGGGRGLRARPAACWCSWVKQAAGSRAASSSS